MASDLYSEVRGAGYVIRGCRVWQDRKRDAAAVRMIAAAVGLYLLGEACVDVRRAVSTATGYGLFAGAGVRSLS
jgi:hypothetical protein